LFGDFVGVELDDRVVEELAPADPFLVLNYEHLLEHVFDEVGTGRVGWEN